MKEILKAILFIEWFLIIIINALIFYQNIWIYYSQNRTKHKWFPFLNPLSADSYELMISSLLTFNWKENNKNKRLKRNVNKLSKLLGFLVLFIVLTLLLFLYKS